MTDQYRMNPMQVESELLRFASLLEERCEDYSRAIEASASAEATWKRMAAESMLDVIESHRGQKMTVAEKEARVEVLTADEHKTYLICDAHAKSVRESLTALRSQIEALRTLSANHRAMTGP